MASCTLPDFVDGPCAVHVHSALVDTLALHLDNLLRHRHQYLVHIDYDHHCYCPRCCCSQRVRIELVHPRFDFRPWRSMHHQRLSSIFVHVHHPMMMMMLMYPLRNFVRTSLAEIELEEEASCWYFYHLRILSRAVVDSPEQSTSRHVSYTGIDLYQNTSN